MLKSRRTTFLALVVWATIVNLSAATTATADSRDGTNSCPALLQHEFQLAFSSRTINLCEHKGEVLLIVNTASRCGFTPQFEGLEALHQEFHDQGFTVLGFPSNDFRQELADNKAIAEYCKLNYGVSFPVFSKTPVTGDNANPVFRQLAEETGQEPEWNFFKYVVDRHGRVVGHFSSRVTPEDEDLRSVIRNALDR